VFDWLKADKERGSGIYSWQEG